MIRHRPTACALVLGLLVAAGCGNGGNSPVPDAGPPPIDQCLSATDMALMQSDGGVDAGGLSLIGEKVRQCALGPCYTETLGNGDAGACINNCLDGSQYAPLSNGCRGCYIESFFCGRDNCALPCLGSDVAACQACILADCHPRFVECAGFEPM